MVKIKYPKFEKFCYLIAFPVAYLGIGYMSYVVFDSLRFQAITLGDAIAFLIWPSLLWVIIILTLSGLREYELTKYGITVISVFIIRRFYPWETFRFIYAIEVKGSHSQWIRCLVFSKEELPTQLKRRQQTALYFLMHPIRFRFATNTMYTAKVEKQIRETLPQLNIEYRIRLR